MAATRTAIIALLAAGIFFAATGSGLALSGFADQDQAAVSQYGQGVLPDSDSDDDEAVPPGGDTDAEVQQPRQVQQGVTGAVSGGELPFTGFAALPVLFAGIAFLVAGLILRRRGSAGPA